MLTAQDCYDVIEGTWCPAHRWEAAGWTLRDGGGGGKRVSAATHRDAVLPNGIPAAEQAMQEIGQTPLFMIREGEEALDTALAELGYTIIDPVSLYAAPIDLIAAQAPTGPRVVACDAPLARTTELWAEGGIGPSRLQVMARVPGPKSYLMGRVGDRPSGAAFVALHGAVAMVHALEVSPSARRNGLGRDLTAACAAWAAHQGATFLSLVCVTTNTAANTLYRDMQFTLIGHYHYRIKESTL